MVWEGYYTLKYHHIPTLIIEFEVQRSCCRVEDASDVEEIDVCTCAGDNKLQWHVNEPAVRSHELFWIDAVVAPTIACVVEEVVDHARRQIIEN